MEGRWKSALLGPDGVAPSRMVGVSASVNLPLHHKVQRFSSGTGSPGWSRKMAVNRLCVCCNKSTDDVRISFYLVVKFNHTCLFAGCNVCIHVQDALL